MGKYVIKTKEGTYLGEDKETRDLNKARIFRTQRMRLNKGDTLIEVRLELVKEVRSK